MRKNYFDFVFIILTYRNTKDLIDFIECTRVVVKNSYKIVVVNSYFDKLSCVEFHDIAIKNNCDFLNVENRGYGYGNNKGIEYAKSSYHFKFLIVSNPDILINKLSIEDLVGLEKCIIASLTRTLTGKIQNPYYYSKIELVEWLRYYACKSGYRMIAYIGIVINKLHRELMFFANKLLKNKQIKIYAAHGSFVILGFKALNELGTLYNERMFLFSEEDHLARLAHEKNIRTYMVPAIKVLHKEDGSLGLENENLYDLAKESYITYYETWKKTASSKGSPNNV